MTTTTLSLRLSTLERARFEQAAAEEEMPLGTWIRFAAHVYLILVPMMESGELDVILKRGGEK